MQPKESQDNRRGVGPWLQNRPSERLRMGRSDSAASPLSRIPEPSSPGIMPIDRFVKDIVVPFGQRVVAAQDRVTAGINKLLGDFPSLSDFSGSPSGFALAAETAGFGNAEQLMYARSLSDRITDLKDNVDQRIARLSQRSLAPGVPMVVLDAFYPKDRKATGGRHLNKRNVVYAAGGAVGGLTLAGIILKACEAASASQGHSSPSIPSIPIGPGITPTPEGGVGVHPLVVVCPNPTQMGDQKYPLSAVTPRMSGVVEFKNVNPTDTVLATQLVDTINKQFGPNDLVICSPAFGEGVSPVISVYPFDNAGGGNFKWFVMLQDGRLVGPKEDRLFTPDNKWVQANDVAHYSLGRAGEGKFDSMVFTAPRKNATDPEIIVGILDRTSGKVLTGKEMTDKYGGVFSNVPFAILASLDQFKQSIPADLLSSVDHFGYVPTPTPDGKTGMKLAALRSDGTVVFALGQETPKATVTPSPTVRPTPTETLVPRMPELKVEGAKFKDALGNEVVLRGAVSPHFIQDGRRLGGLTAFKRDVSDLKSWGANFVIVDWNSGYATDQYYVESLVSALEYAKSLGLRVELSLHSRGLKTVSGGQLTNQQIEIVTADIVNDWDLLLDDPAIAKRIGDVVDIYSPLSEPQKGGNGQFIDWKEWKDIAQKTILRIRERVKKPQAVGAISGVYWGSDIRDAIGNPPNIPDVGIGWHPYNSTMGTRGIGFTSQANSIIGKNILLFVEEMGWTDNAGQVKEQLDFLQAHGISFAFWGIIASGQGEIMDKSRNLTPNGQILKDALSLK